MANCSSTVMNAFRPLLFLLVADDFVLAVHVVERVAELYPVLEAPVEVHDLRVSHIRQGRGCQPGTAAGSAVQHDSRIGVLDEFLDRVLQLAAGKPLGSANVAGLVFRLGADIQQNEILFFRQVGGEFF